MSWHKVKGKYKQQRKTSLKQSTESLEAKSLQMCFNSSQCVNTL
jgi:hypothetical protein